MASIVNLSRAAALRAFAAAAEFFFCREVARAKATQAKMPCAIPLTTTPSLTSGTNMSRFECGDFGWSG